MEKHTISNGVLNTHTEDKCFGETCCIHMPSEHHMREWPMLWRSDILMMERTCPHGVGHPDPDALAYEIAQGRGWLSVHGCDGCCSVRPCRCPEGAYEGARLAGTPRRCERCRGLVDEEASALLEKIYEKARVELEQWAKDNPLSTEDGYKP